MNEAEVVAQVAFIPDQDAAVVLQPGKEPLHFPAAFVAAQLATILGLGLGAVAAVRSDQFNLALIAQALVEWVGVIGLVTDEPLGRFIEPERI